MPEKQEKVEEVPNVEPEVEPQPEPQTKTFTQGERDAAVAQAREEEAGKYKGFQRIVSAREEENKRLREQVNRVPSTRPIEIILEEMKARQTVEGEPNPRIALLETELVRERQREATETQRLTQQVQETMDGYRKRTETLGLTEEDEEYWEIHDLVVEGYQQPSKLRRADIKLRKLEEVKGKKPEAKVETEDDGFAKRLEEEKRKWMEEQGLLGAETGLPSAGSSSWVEFERRYIAGEVPLGEYEKRARLEGKL